MLSGDREEITRLHTDKAFPFCLPEQLIYLICKLTPARRIAKYFFIKRYEKNKAATR